ELTFEPNVNIHAEGSVLVSFGNTKVICTASIDTNVPRWMRGSEEGWVTAEYGMLPRSTNERMGREAARGKQSGRTQEIQRLIGRSLRQAVNLKYIKGKTINIDCDVIQADGGTRTASITGGCVALFLALKNHHDDHRAIKTHVAAVSLGVLNDQVILDLDYNEDSTAETDLNLVMTDSLELIEIQGTGEEAPFSKEQLNEMLEVGSSAIADIIEKQKACLK
ncbi:ribonuclease PH, partial [Gammaproteobacteria bacterium]|nr:ribonuclease PH [Gammaproteobacteria bacterium]